MKNHFLIPQNFFVDNHSNALEYNENQKTTTNYFVHKSIRILHQNINGLNSKADLLAVGIENLKGKPIDVICISEHNMSQDDIGSFSFCNYNLGSHFSRDNRRGGSCILVNQKLKFVQLSDVVNYSVPNIVECSGIKLLECNVYVINIYRIPVNLKHNRDVFLDILNSILTKFSSKKTVITGDFNINILESSNFTVDFMNVCYASNFKIALREITRFASGKCLDNILFNISGCKSHIAELAVSDHSAIIIDCPVKTFCTLKYWFKSKRDYSKENIDKFVNCLGQLGFSGVFDENNDPNKAFNEFHDIFSLIYDLCFPEIKFKINPRKRQRWISKGIRACSTVKRNFLWKYRKNPNPHNKQKLDEYSLRLKKIIKKTQYIQNRHAIISAENKTKATWKIINNQKYNIPKEDIAKLIVNEKVIATPQQICDEFNNYYIDGISTKPTSERDSKISNRVSQSMYMHPVTTVDILNIIKSLKNKSSVGYDNITTHIIKTVSNTISPVLSHIINLCIQHGVFPDKLKISVVKPLFKKGDKDNICNYRPIALLPVFSKVFEKVIYNSVYSYFEHNQLFCKEQMGFRKGKCINMAIYNFLKQVITSVDKRVPTAAVYMDMSKAFDAVDHEILLNKLYAYGIRGNIHNLLSSYLKGRFQTTQITQLCPNTKTEITYSSSFKIVHHGVPQGSILGPLLFLVYINDLPETTGYHITLFADDSTVLFNGKAFDDEFKYDINNTIKEVVKWMTNNNLNINIDKTNYMTFSQRPNTTMTLDINYNGQSISKTKVTKFLGLNIDTAINWKDHVEYVRKKVNQSRYALSRLSNIVDLKTVLAAYHGYVASVLRYGLIFWGNSTDVQKVFKAQKQCIRGILHIKKRDSCKPHFQSLKIFTLPSLYIYETILFVKNNFNLFDQSERARHRYKLCNFPGKTAMLRKSVLGMAPMLYNNLPVYLLKEDNLKIFKGRLRDILINKAYYTVNEFLNDVDIN